MTVSEVYSKIIQHMIKGLMLHGQLADYYWFLGLEGYARRHEYHYAVESESFRHISRYFICHHNELAPELPVENPNVIPENWRKYTRWDVDASTKMNGIKNGIEEWHEWEKSTKKLYESMYSELLSSGHIADAIEIKKLICDVTKELKSAEKHTLKSAAIDYSLDVIIPEQKCLHNKYKKKLARIYDEH